MGSERGLLLSAGGAVGCRRGSARCGPVGVAVGVAVAVGVGAGVCVGVGVGVLVGVVVPVGVGVFVGVGVTMLTVTMDWLLATLGSGWLLPTVTMFVRTPTAPALTVVMSVIVRKPLLGARLARLHVSVCGPEL